jgi:hypothetical protein
MVPWPGLLAVDERKGFDMAKQHYRDGYVYRTQTALSREIDRLTLDKVNRLTLSVGESTVKVVIVPLSTAKAKISEVGRQGRRVSLTS